MNSVDILHRLEALNIKPSGKPWPTVPHSSAGFEAREPLDFAAAMATADLPASRGSRAAGVVPTSGFGMTH